ncbi:hypothetical protein J5X84_14785 [Streptosporangiaceae bacterium NEAU-GS5]|nr:hypothetical protein [Streptosporangiaceae bacterium NEAU-GS5]
MYQKYASITAAALVSLSVAPATAVAANPPYIQIRPGYSMTVKESGSRFRCPEDQVLTGRAHHGDENGSTTYYCGFIYIDYEKVIVPSTQYKVRVKERGSDYATPEDHAIGGRDHDGDENGMTTYYSAEPISWRGQPVHLVYRRWTDDMKESSHTSLAGYGEIMTGRRHSGDENGPTAYQYATVTCCY